MSQETRLDRTPNSDESVICDKRISSEGCNVLNELRKAGQLCDVAIRVEDGFFPVHRAILSACSPYFRALFTNGMSESIQKEVFIPNVTMDIMALIVEYAYTRDVKITSENVEQLLPVADQFNVLGLIKKCCEFLRNQVEPENAIGIRNFAKSYFCHKLQKYCHRYILENFMGVAKNSEEFMQLAPDDIIELISADELNVKNEEFVFDACLKWIEYSPQKRKIYMLNLMKCIRLGLLSTQYFVETVKVHPFVKDNEDCRPLVIDTLKFLYDLDMNDGKEIDLTHPLARPRLPHEILFAVGGWSGGSPTNVIESYDTRADRWVMIESTDKGPRAYHGCATIGYCIYIVGGFDGMDYFNSVRCFDPVKHKWREVAPMNARRCYVSVISHRNYIYALGGFNGVTRMNNGERWNSETNSWSNIADMYSPRSNFGIEVLDDMVFVIGGFNGVTTIYNVECYDPNTEDWYDATDMNIYRSALSACIIKGLPNIQDYVHKDRLRFDDKKKRNNHQNNNGMTNSGVDPSILPASSIQNAS